LLCEKHHALAQSQGVMRRSMPWTLAPRDGVDQCQWEATRMTGVESEASAVTTPDPVLCYVEGPWAYFTTQALSDQSGDDWDDAWYEYNAGPPYEPCEDEAGAWRIVRVVFVAGVEMEQPCCTSSYSVDDVNAKRVPWLMTARWCGPPVPRVFVWAGTPLSEFIRVIQADGGHVYTEAPHVGG
jgi:hypothetical protein